MEQSNRFKRHLRAIAFLAGISLVMPATGCMTDFATDVEDDQFAGVSWVARWLLKAFTSANEIVLDVKCRAEVRLGKDPEWTTVEYDFTATADEVYRVAKAHPSWAWGQIVDFFREFFPEVMNAQVAKDAADRYVELLDSGVDAEYADFVPKTDGVICSVKPRFAPPPEPVKAPPKCPLDNDGCPDNPDTPWPDEPRTPAYGGQDQGDHQ